MSEPMSDDRLQEIRERVEAATRSPWWAWDRGVGFEIAVGEPFADGHPSAVLPFGFRTDIGRREDAEFIAAARQDVPALLAEVDRLKAALAEREAHDAPIAAIAQGMREGKR